MNNLLPSALGNPTLKQGWGAEEPRRFMSPGQGTDHDPTGHTTSRHQNIPAGLSRQVWVSVR